MTIFALNSANVVYETFDEEIVAVNLETGNYYSISGTGPRIWIDLIHGRAIAEIVRRIQMRHIGDADTIAASVNAFAEKLIENALLIPASGGTSVPTETIEPEREKTPFSPPVIESYADMRDLLMLDPIHDVDDKGWPKPKA
jgi:hypothetical protein